MQKVQVKFRAFNFFLPSWKSKSFQTTDLVEGASVDVDISTVPSSSYDTAEWVEPVDRVVGGCCSGVCPTAMIQMDSVDRNLPLYRGVASIGAAGAVAPGPRSLRGSLNPDYCYIL